jgi:hypothetical protein
MYEIKRAGAKGFGVFAKQLIPRGTRIFSEPPLISLRQDQDASAILTAARSIALRDRAQLLKLSTTISRELSIIRWVHVIYYNLKQTVFNIRDSQEWSLPRLRALREQHRIVSIFRNNAFNLDSLSKFRQAVFNQISRLNHSCVPNAQGNFNDALGVFNVHATRQIEAGEEVTLNYLPEHSTPRALRQTQLQSTYNFTCTCAACSLATVRDQDGEVKRIQIHRDITMYGEEAMKSGNQNQEAELKIVKSLIQLLEDEDVAGREVAALYVLFHPQITSNQFTLILLQVRRSSKTVPKAWE